MAVSEHNSGTQTAVLGTEHFLGTDPEATDGAFQFVVNMINLVNGETVVLKLYEAALAADTVSDLIKLFTISNAQVEDLWVSPAFILLHRWRFSLTQTGGTGRAFKWSIRKVA